MTIQQAFEAALRLHQSGRLGEADTIYSQILCACPNHADAQHLRGVIAHQFGNHHTAISLIEKAIFLNPANAFAHCNLGEAYRALGILDQAIISYHRAIELNPECGEFHNNLGIALAVDGQLPEATVACRRAIELNPSFADAHNNLGNILRDQRRLEEAIDAYQSAIYCNPKFADAYHNLSNVLRQLGFHVQASLACQRALQLKPDFPEAIRNLGDEQRNNGDLDSAIASYRRALLLKTNYPEALNNLGETLKNRGDLEDSVIAFRQATQIDPHYAIAHSNLIYTLLFLPNAPRTLLFVEQKHWNERFRVPESSAEDLHSNLRQINRRLRVGYISPDFSDHVIGRNLLPLISNHNHADFDIVCYADQIRTDDITDQFRRHVANWRDITGMPDENVAQLVRHDRVDILVDLSQHLAGNRLLAFTRRPAPVQASFAGYPATTGTDAIRYRITDKFLEPPAASGNSSSEQLFRSDTFWCYDPCGMEVNVNELPASNAGSVTFGSLNNFCKVNEPLLKLWARVLKEVKDSRLIILSHEGSHRQRTLQFLAIEGVASHRVEFVTPRPRKEYLELYHQIDIVLDTFPYNGHTTSLDALWMGVPVVSLCGERPVSRAGLSQLSNLGLPELVAFNEDQYVEIATKLANNIPRLQELRATLRQRMEKSVLMDGAHFARQIEACYRSMWRQWCESQKP